MTPRIFAVFTKFDARDGSFVGVATAEVQDQDGETIDLDASWPEFERFSAECFERSRGLNYGHVRTMHGLTAAGKLTAPPRFDRERRQVIVEGRIVDPATRELAEQGVLTGLSIGGRYKRRYVDAAGRQRYVAAPSEVSVVDNPSVPTALFQLTTRTGEKVMKRFSGANHHSGGDVLSRAEVIELIQENDRALLDDLLKIFAPPTDAELAEWRLR